MVAAKGLILVDIRTQAACTDILFKDLGVITVKGTSPPLTSIPHGTILRCLGTFGRNTIKK